VALSVFANKSPLLLLVYFCPQRKKRMRSRGKLSGREEEVLNLFVVIEKPAAECGGEPIHSQ
jgi:hypothetical protein